MLDPVSVFMMLAVSLQERSALMSYLSDILGIVVSWTRKGLSANWNVSADAKSGSQSKSQQRSSKKYLKRDLTSCWPSNAYVWQQGGQALTTMCRTHAFMAHHVLCWKRTPSILTEQHHCLRSRTGERSSRSMWPVWQPITVVNETPPPISQNTLKRQREVARD